MRAIPLIVLLLLTGRGEASESPCIDKLNEAATLADQLPVSEGRAAVLTEIARARDSLHEGQPQDCVEQIEETLGVLRAGTGSASGHSN